jgi:hypothetical protein
MTCKELRHSRFYRALVELAMSTYGYADLEEARELAWAAIAPYEAARARATGIAAEMVVDPIPGDEDAPFPGWEPFPGQEAA